MASSVKKFLTIGIPTYNRSNYLKECLDHICYQLTSEVQVVVRDNCSCNYDFNSFITPYKEKYGIISIRNRVNVGGDGNVLKLFEECDTEWLWVIGDDDYLLPNAIDTVLQTIKKNSDVLYIDFNAHIDRKTNGLQEFCDVMIPRFAFGKSFFTSELVFRIDQSTEDLYWHYRYLSTRNPQILRIIQHLIDNPQTRCLFSKQLLLENHGEDITWNRMDLVRWQLPIFDIFYEHRKILRNNVFKEIVAYSLVYIDSANIPFHEKWYYYKQLITKFGFFNILKYNKIQFWRIPLRIILPSKIYNKLKQKTK